MGTVVPVVDLALALAGVATGDSLAVRVVLSRTRDGLVDLAPRLLTELSGRSDGAAAPSR